MDNNREVPAKELQEKSKRSNSSRFLNNCKIFFGNLQTSFKEIRINIRGIIVIMVVCVLYACVIFSVLYVGLFLKDYYSYQVLKQDGIRCLSKDTVLVSARRYENISIKNEERDWYDGWYSWKNTKYNETITIEPKRLSYLVSNIYGLDSLLGIGHFFLKNNIFNKHHPDFELIDSLSETFHIYGLKNDENIREGLGWRWEIRVCYQNKDICLNSAAL